VPIVKDYSNSATNCLGREMPGTGGFAPVTVMYAKICGHLLLILLFLCSSDTNAQTFSLPNAYAHNDYRHKRPLLDALENGFTYVEADIYLRNEKLIVAHILPCFKKKRTLEELYFKPLLTYVAENDEKEERVSNFPLTLIIDIKSDGDKTYQKLLVLLEKYKCILSEYVNGCFVQRKVTIVITGHKPAELINGEGNRLAFVDDDLKSPGKDVSIDVYPMASCKYSSLIKWKGKGNMSEREIERLQYYVSRAHKSGRKVRLWASPENKAVWTELLKLNVDLINTNRLKSLRKFLVADMLWAPKKG
jgi:hypothetical protein